MPTFSTTAELGRTIRVARKDAGLTQTELAERSGCSQRFISQLERGKQTVELGKVLDVVAALGLTVSISQRASSLDARQTVSQAISKIERSLSPSQEPKRGLASYLAEARS